MSGNARRVTNVPADGDFRVEIEVETRVREDGTIRGDGVMSWGGGPTPVRASMEGSRSPILEQRGDVPYWRERTREEEESEDEEAEILKTIDYDEFSNHFQELLLAVRVAHARDFVEEFVKPLANSFPMGREGITGALVGGPTGIWEDETNPTSRSAYNGTYFETDVKAAGSAMLKPVPEWPLISRFDHGRPISHPDVFWRDFEPHNGLTRWLKFHSLAAYRFRDETEVQEMHGVLGYTVCELLRFARTDRGSCLLLGEKYPTPGACVRHFVPGRTWLGKISIPTGNSRNAHVRESEYVMQVLWYDVAAGAFLITHNAESDEQMCHLRLTGDGAANDSLALEYYDAETFCKGEINGETGVITGFVSQLLSPWDNVFAHSDPTLHRFTLYPVVHDSEHFNDCPACRPCMVQRNADLIRWSRGTNVTKYLVRAINFVKTTVTSDHMQDYLLRKITYETDLLNVAFPHRCVEGGIIDAYPMTDSELKKGGVRCMAATRRDEVYETEWMHVLRSMIWHFRLLSCKMRLYERVFKERTFKSVDERQEYVENYITFREDSHVERNSGNETMRILFTRFKDTYKYRRLYEEKQAILDDWQVCLARLDRGYDAMDRELRALESRLPMDFFSKRYAIAKKHDPLAPNALDTHTCSICIGEIDEGDEIIALECYHNFHRHCISTWFHSHQTCPNCRKVLT